ncbi:MAG: hypothetical protein HZA60_05305, partial [Deltaproteobacteria bacterium]|nr:hypothetical protein [Deltaproteobacteria bacterium]
MTSSDNSGSWFFPEFAPPFPEPVENPISELFDAALSGAHSPSADPRDPERSLHEARQQVAQIEKEAYEKAFLLGEKAGRELGETA